MISGKEDHTLYQMKNSLNGCRMLQFFAYVVMLLAAFILFLMLLFACLEPAPAGQALCGKEAAAFDTIRQKHFHKGSPSIVYTRMDGTMYFIRDGKVCEFR